MNTHRAWMLRGLLLTGLGLLSPAAAQADDGVDEVTVYGISDFGDYWNCGDIGDQSLDHSVHLDTAGAFKGTFDYYKNLLLWDATRTANDPYARGTYWNDASRSAICSGCTAQDAATSGADSADVVFIHTHGGHDATSTQLLMGSASYGCTLDTDQHALFGNSDLEIAVVKACQSGDYDVWLAGGYNALISLSGEFSMWNAFHGDSSCGSHVTSYVNSYAGSSYSDGAGENWLDEAYDSWGADDCPVSIVWGSTYANRESQYRYGGWGDRKSTGFKSASTIFYVAGCDPDNGRVLPSP